MEENHPYLIKVSSTITYENGFTVKNVNINPEEAIVSFGYTTGSEKNTSKFLITYQVTRPTLSVRRVTF